MTVLRTRARAHLRARRRAAGAQPVGLRAHALLPPQARRHEPHHPHRLRARRDLRRAGRALHGGLAAALRRELPQLAEPGAVGATHLFGTDQLGRDYFSRVIYGVQTSLGVAIVVALLSTFIGTAHRRGRRLLRRRDRQRRSCASRTSSSRVPGLAVLLVAAAYLGSVGGRRAARLHLVRASRSRW